MPSCQLLSPSWAPAASLPAHVGRARAPEQPCLLASWPACGRQSRYLARQRQRARQTLGDMRERPALPSSAQLLNFNAGLRSGGLAALLMLAASGPEERAAPPPLPCPSQAAPTYLNTC